MNKVDAQIALNGSACPTPAPAGPHRAAAAGSPLRSYHLLLAISVVLPALLFALAAWENHGDVMRENRDTMARTAAVMQEHARKVMETAELAIGEIDQHIDDQDWAHIANPATSDFLRRLKGSLDQFVSFWIADADGMMRAGSQPWPSGSGIGTRPFFQAQQQADRGTYVGPVFSGLATATPSFAIIRRRTTADGSFDGTIHAAASPAYFAGYYAEAAPPVEHTALLLRADGAVLARDPLLPGTGTTMTPGTGSASMPSVDQGLLNALAAGTMEGRTTATAMPRGHYAARKVGRWPLYVVFAVPHEVMLARWHHNLRIYGAVAAGTSLVLLLISWFALRRARAEQRALALLRAESAQRQEAEAQLRHAQRMDAVGQLTGGVAHDFNNLLTAILGNLELIERAAASPAGLHKIPRLAGTAMKAVKRGTGLTRALLAFSRKQQMQPRPIDANRLLHDFLDLVRQAVGARVSVVFEPASSLPACVADPVELEAAVLNLAINARDAMPGGGTLRFRTGIRALDAGALAGNPEAQPGAFVFIAVADTGPGMTPDVAAKAFEPFFTTKPIGKGTGLGLSQVFGFVRQLNGHVTIECPPGQGTTVTLFLPVAAETVLAA